MKTAIKTTGHVQFKPTSVMSGQLKIAAKKWDVSVNQLARNMIALSLNGIPIRNYVFIQLMARANNNLNSFEECASHIGSFLKGRFDDPNFADFNEVTSAIILESDKYMKDRE
jgi:hypothetical protein